jgi:ubiquinone/menaquinone biosynthesis C-methylase UbiE
MLDNSFVIKSFSSPKEVEYYKSATINLGLWQSEIVCYKKYLMPDDKILDLGCGMGRTTFGLYKLGFQNIIGIDITEKMIYEAKEIAKNNNVTIPFIERNATNLNFNNESFDKVIHSFNGLMMIPNEYNRIAVLQEVNRVLKTGGIYIFTTHDRKNRKFVKFWESEAAKWGNNLQDKRFDKFGDITFKNKDGIEQFAHIPTKEEILFEIQRHNFELIEVVQRSKLAKENSAVKKFADDCLFWTIKKLKNLDNEKKLPPTLYL